MIKHIFTLLLFGIKAAAQKIAEEKQLQYEEHDEELDKNNDPELFAHGHSPETIIIEKENTPEHLYHHALYCTLYGCELSVIGSGSQFKQTGHSTQTGHYKNIIS